MPYGGKGSYGGKGRGYGGGKGGGAGKAAVVQLVKQNQRSSPLFRQAWANYCDAKAGGVRDPEKQSKGWLDRAVLEIGDGRHLAGPAVGLPAAIPIPRSAPSAPRSRGPRPQPYHHAHHHHHHHHQATVPRYLLVDQVKTSQRADPGWYQAWGNYCFKNGQGVNDPNSHSDAWLQRALQILGPPQQVPMYDAGLQPLQATFPPFVGGGYSRGPHVPHKAAVRMTGRPYSRGGGGGYGSRQGMPRSRGAYGGPRLSRGGGQRTRSRGGGGGGGPQRTRSRGGLSGGGIARSRGGFRPH
eukprot:TRINITY_DN801_c2_g2_i1.p1 TRINITY_DN801_c2_g2~~TRINITY_DN801_c2_g2_i1.p1  ORF type:complete len:329 (+),score=63.83 TRINITY_DN801_c2_g2_i1:99-989(+)